MIIGIFTDTYEPDVNGVATTSKTLRDVFLAQGHRVIVVTTGLPKQKEVTFENDVLRIPGVVMKFLYGYRATFIFNNKAFSILRKIPFDVIHIQQEFSISVFGRLCGKKLHVPLVYTYHTSYSDYARSLNHGISDNFAKNTIKTLAKFAIPSNCEVITPTLKARKQLKDAGISRYINVVPNAFDFTPFKVKNDPKKEEAFRKEHHLEGKRILLSLGRLSFDKNVAELIHAFTAYKIKYEDKDAVLLIVGSGPEEKNLKKEALASPFHTDILFLGPVSHEETSFYYHLCDLYLSASTSETPGITYPEAIASNTLVIAKKDSNVEELIKEDVTGYLYQNVDELPDTIHKALSITPEQKETILKAANEKNNELFSRQAFYERMLHVYQKAIRRNF
jgi:1,2-diacylglycerol 3-alpha-glucosyltransferase